MKKLTGTLLALMLFCCTSAAISQVDYKQVKSTAGKFHIVNTTTADTAKVQSLTGDFDLLNIGLKIRSSTAIDSFTVVGDTLKIWVGATQYNAFLPGAVPSGTTTFLGLTDSPSSYAGQGGNFAVVNVGETALEFAASSVTPHAILSATHNDAATSTVIRGDIVTGQTATPQWDRLVLGVSGTLLRSDGTDLAYTTATWPTTTTINQLLFSSAANTVTGLATANNGILVTGGTGIPSISSTIPNATQDNITRLGTIASIGAPLGVTFGGSGADLSATGGANQFVRQSSSGGTFTVSALADADIVDHTGEVTGGTALTIARGTSFNWTGVQTWTLAGAVFDFQNTTDASTNQLGIFRGGSRGTSADNDSSYISFFADTDVSGLQEFVRMTYRAVDVTNFSKDSDLLFDVMVDDALTRILRIEGAGVDVVGDLVISGLVDGKDIDTNAAMLNEAETITSDWINTANPWANNEVAEGLTIAGGIIGTSAITLVQGVAPTPTAEGVIEWETDDDHIIVGDAAAQVEFVPAEDISGSITMTDAGVTTIGAAIVTNAMHANMAQNTVKMRVAAGAGDPEDIDISAGLSLVTAASGDFVIVEDATDGNIRRVDAGDFLGGGVTYDAIGDAAGNGSIGMGATEQIWVSSQTSGDVSMFTLDINQVDDGAATDDLIAWSIDATSESGDAGDTFTLMRLLYENGVANTILDRALLIDNAETTAATMVNAIEITSSGVNGGVVDAIDVSASNITNAINIGSNDFITSASTISSAELDRLDGLAGTIVTDATAVTSVDGTSLTISGGTLNVDAASVTVVGASELATGAETTTGTDATRAVTPDGLAGSDYGIRYIPLLVTADFTTAMTVADRQTWFHIPPGLNGWNLIYVHAEVQTSGTTGTATIQVHNIDNALDMLSTLLSLDTGETGSDTAATPAVINTSNDHVNTNDIIRIDVDVIHTTPAQGLLVTLGFQNP